jgi:PAS domain S-box-containing protein
MKALFKLLTKTIRRQLVISVAIVHAVLMVLFVWDLTVRQQDLLLERQIEQAEALARSVATSSAGWVVARDLYGLQEIVTAQSRYPELIFAMILDADGRILAHSDTELVGQFVTDLPAKPVDSILTRSPDLVDAISPIILAGYHQGWVRIGLGQKVTAERLALITRDGILYAIAAIIIGSIMAWVMGSRLTKRLRNIETSADFVEQGDLHQRAIVAGHDEVAHVAHAFNQMLDSMQASREELEQSEERFNLAMLATNDGLWDWNLKNDEVYYSIRWKSMLGYFDQELEPDYESWKRLVDPVQEEKTLELIQDTIKSGKSGFTTEFRMKHKDGHWVDILSRGGVVRNESGEAVRLVGTHTDVTDLRSMERELINHRDHLEQMVRDRTEELEEARKAADKANFEKSQFLANMSHELRTPMHSIIGFTNILMKRDLDEKSQQFLENIKTSAVRLTLLLNDLLDLSKLEAGKMQINFAECSLNNVVDSCIKDVHSLLDEKHLNVDFSSEEEFKLECDHKLITQVIINLLSNAIKFSPEKGLISITLNQTEAKLAGLWQPVVELVISDQGIGIPESELKTVFDKFVQSTKTDSHSGGTGLGLPICRQIVLRHHGRIWAESPLDKQASSGTAFKIILPMRQS